MLTYKDNTFLINGKEEFIFGGELHYFRVPKSEWKDRINKIKEAGFNLVSTYIPWIWHEKSEGNIDLIGATCDETDLKSFIEYVEEAGLYLLVRPGPYVMAEIENAGLPFWLLENYSEIRSLKGNGEFHPIYELVSYLHPTYLEKVDNWYKEVFAILSPHQIDNGGCIVSCQLDNEVGMFHWVTGTPDFNPNILEHFTNYLEGSEVEQRLKELTGLTDTNEIIVKYVKSDLDSLELAKKTSVNNIVNEEYQLFFRFYIKDYLEALKKIAEKYGLNVPIVVNVHGFGGGGYAKSGEKYPIGLSQLYEASKIENSLVAGDYYVGNIVYENYHHVVLANAYTKAIQPEGQPLFSAEFQGGFQIGVPRLQPTTYDLKTRLTIANGMNAINYYMFVGGENYDHIGIISKRHDWQAPVSKNGKLRRSYDVIKNIVNVVNSYGTDFLYATPKVSTTLALNIEYYMNEYNNDDTIEQTRHITMIREAFIYEGIAKSMAMTNINFDSLDLNAVERIDVVKYPSLVMPSTKYMSEKIQTLLVNYIKDGGNLVLNPEVPTKNMINEDCTILKDFLEIEIVNDSVWGCVDILEHESINCGGSQIINVPNSTTIATLEKDKNAVCGVIKNVGNAQVCILTSKIRNEWDYMNATFTDLFSKVGIVPTVDVVATDYEDWVNVLVREYNETSFVFVNNFEDFDKEITINVNGQNFDNNKIIAPLRCGLILPVNWNVSDNLKVIYSMSEVTNVSNNYDLTFTVKYKGDKVRLTGQKPLDSNEYTVECVDNDYIVTFNTTGSVVVKF